MVQFLNFKILFKDAIFLIFTAMVSGLFIDKLNYFLQIKFNLNIYISILLQTLFIIIILWNIYLIRKLFNYNLFDDIHFILFGLIFPNVFFGIQTNYFNNMRKIIE